MTGALRTLDAHVNVCAMSRALDAIDAKTLQMPCWRAFAYFLALQKGEAISFDDYTRDDAAALQAQQAKRLAFAQQERIAA